MKREKLIFSVGIFSIVAIILLVLFWIFSFTKSPSIPSLSSQQSVDMDRPFSAIATIHLDDSTVVADINRTATDALTLKVTEPEILNGLICSYNGKDIELSYKNMKVNLNDNTLLSKTATAVIVSAINASKDKTGISVQSEQGKLVVQGELEQGKFSLWMNPKDGSFLQLSIPNLDLECNFSDFTFLSGASSSPDSSQSTPS